VLLERCLSLGIFGHEVTGQLVKPVEPQPELEKPTLDELLQTTSAESREGKRKLEAAVQDAAFAEASPLFAEWLSHLYSDFEGFIPTHDDKRYILNNWIPRSNLSYTQVQTYHKARRHMVAIHRWSDSLLLPDEKLALEVENTHSTDYHTQRELARRVRDSRG